MSQGRRRFLVLVVVAATVVFDQLSKIMATRLLAGAPPRAYVSSLFVLEYAENPGAILSLGGALSPQARFWIFTVVVAALLTFMLVAALGSFRLTVGEIVGLALIAGGGFSNLGDRLFNHGLVIDFMNMGMGRLRTGVFNLADLAIVAGAIVLLIAGLRFRRA